LSRRGERFAESFSAAADRIARSGTFLRDGDAVRPVMTERTKLSVVGQ